MTKTANYVEKQKNYVEDGRAHSLHKAYETLYNWLHLRSAKRYFQQLET